MELNLPLLLINFCYVINVVDKDVSFFTGQLIKTIFRKGYLSCSVSLTVETEADTLDLIIRSFPNHAVGLQRLSRYAGWGKHK